MPIGKIYQQPNFQVTKQVEVIHEIITTSNGTVHHETIIEHILHPNNAQRQDLIQHYRQKFGGADLVNDLKKNLPPSEAATNNLFLALLDTPAEHDAKYLDKAMKGLGTNEDILIEILVTRTNAQLRAIKVAYKQVFNRELVADIGAETSGSFKTLLLDLLEGNRDESHRVDVGKAHHDANELYKAGEGKWGTDEDAFIKVLANQNLSQLQALFNEYEKLGKKHSIEQAIKAEFSGDELNCLLAICGHVRNGPVGEVAELLHKCLQHGAKDDLLIHLIVTHSEFDLQDIETEYEKRFKVPLEQAIQKSGKSTVLKNTLVRMMKGNN